MNKKNAIKNLMLLRKKGFSFFYNGHIKYLKEDILVSIEFLKNTKSKKIKLLISDALVEVGQLFEIILSLPTIALRFYKKSLKFNPINRKAEAYLADCYQDVDKFKLAIKHYKKSIKIDENYPWVHEEILECKKKLNENKLIYNYYDIFSLEYKAEECLGNLNPDKAKSIIKNKKKKEFKLIQINIFGYENQLDEYLKAWEKYFENGNTVYLSRSDWFYMPLNIYNGSKIWEIFLKHHKSIENSCFIQFDTLTQYSITNKSLKIQKIICQYMIYKLSKNIKGLKKLQKKFPRWIELNQEIKSQMQHSH